MISKTLTGPKLKTALPGPNARRILASDEKYISPSYTRSYPLVARRGRGIVVEDVDGNEFFDFSAGIAVTSTGHCHPHLRSQCRGRVWQPADKSACRKAKCISHRPRECAWHWGREATS